MENFVNTGPILHAAKINRVFVVTSPDHISRAVRDAIRYWGPHYPELTTDLYGTASATFYSARTIEDQKIAKIENVVIAEPPIMKFFDLNRIIRLSGNATFVSKLTALLDRYGH